MNELNFQGIEQENSGFEPIELEMNSKTGDAYELVLNEDDLMVRNKAGEVERRVPQNEAGLILELKPSIGNRSVLKIKAMGDEHALVFRTQQDQLRTIRKWMEPLTPEMMKQALQSLVFQKGLIGIIFLVFLIGGSIDFITILWCIMAFGLAGGAFFWPRFEWFLADIVFDLFILMSLFIVGIFSPISLWCLGALFLLILSNLPNKVAVFRLWNI